MITGKEYLKKHVGETNIPEEHFENEIGEIMDWYADDYHQEQVKNLSLSGVSQQRELLTGFVRFERLQDYKYKLLPLSEKIEKYLASL